MMNKGNAFKKPFLKSGKFSKYAQLYADAVGLERSEVGGPFTRVWYTPFDPSKTAKIKEVMFEYGWIPDEWNEKKMNLLDRRQKSVLRRKSYNEFLLTLPLEEREETEAFINGFIDKHFYNRTKLYMRGVLRALGFTGAQPPTFGQIKKKLLGKGFWPTSPKINPEKDQWASEGHSEIAELLRVRMQCSHRKSLLEGLLRVTRSDGKISGEANPCATPTARMRHRKIVNIPAAGAFLGKECRSLFQADNNSDADRNPILFYNHPKEGQRVKHLTNMIEEWDDKKEKWVEVGYYRIYVPADSDVFVGGDGAGLELRMLTHYLIAISKMLLEESKKSNDLAGVRKYERALEAAYEYRTVLLEGDIHSHNQKLAGLPTRGAAKGFIYSFLYGAGDPLLGSQVGGGAEEGKELRARFLAECPCIPVLIEWVQEHAATHGWVPGLDGRRLIMRRDPETGSVQTHKALNVLLQAAGSIVMKKGMLILHEWNEEGGVRANQVIMMHKQLCI
ncbi:DNA polymerase [Vibrio phage Vp_R1]|uniref:DNA polymerase n=1 Tax=Vibrio phage Vp_R1 TaxID=2059867 RepID=A0A2H5BQ99_9CAUD|nr:DNA polymerase [Vibrio phage Vp_R1]AUG88511.1 DNA polymerase [Vibrio phage Vp_R1]